MSVLTAVMVLVVLGSSVWVGADASRRTWTGDRFADAPWKWVLGCLLLWIVVFPVYLVRRSTRPVGSDSSTASRNPGAGGHSIVETRRNMPIFWWGVGSVAAMAVGAFGPWAKVAIAGISVNGTDGSNDGWVVLGAALLVLLCVLGQHRSNALVVIGCAAGLGGLAVGVYDHYNIETKIDEAGSFGNLVVIGWGLNLVIAASLSAAIQAVLAARFRKSLHRWKAMPAERNVLVQPDGGIAIPHKTSRPRQYPAAPAFEVPKPGWYVDPADAQRLRYWNGDSWAEHTARLDSNTASS